MKMIFNIFVHCAQTVKAEELFELTQEELLFRLYHQETVRLFEKQEISFKMLMLKRALLVISCLYRSK